MANESSIIHYIQEEWMWKQRPPILSPAQFAIFIGYNKQTVYNWWNGQIPTAQALILIANKTGLSLPHMLDLCGYPVPRGLIDKDKLINRLQENGDRVYTSEEIAEIIDQLQIS